MKQISRAEASVLYAHGITVGLGARRKGASWASIKSVSKHSGRAKTLDEAVQLVEFVRAYQNRKPVAVTEFYVY